MLMLAILLTADPNVCTTTAADLTVCMAAVAPVAAPAQDEPTKKPKKKAKTAAADQPPSPDEEVDEGGEGVDVEGGPRFVWKQHPSFRWGSIFRADVEGQFQEDAHAAYEGADVAAGLNTFEMHRNRIGIKGKLFSHVEYEVERELTEKELTAQQAAVGRLQKPQWKDVYVNLTTVKRAQIEVGKFKIPFGLDELTGVTHNDFVYRSLGANYLAPGRDIGAMVHGRLFKRGFTYAAGVFKQDGDNARSSTIWGADRTVAMRITAAPLRRVDLAGGALGALQLGAAVAVSTLANDSFEPNGLRARTVLTQDTFFHAVYVQGQRRRWEGDADWASGPLSARTEFTLVTDQRLQQGIANDDLSDARYRSWYASGTWVVTGEEKTRPLKARSPLLQGGIGAVELAARYERLWVDSVGGAGDQAFRNPRAAIIFPSGDRVLTFGINWTPNRFVKLQFNVFREQVEDPERNPVPNGAAFWNRALRVQFVL